LQKAECIDENISFRQSFPNRTRLLQSIDEILAGGEGFFAMSGLDRDEDRRLTHADFSGSMKESNCLNRPTLPGGASDLFDLGSGHGFVAGIFQSLDRRASLGPPYHAGEGCHRSAFRSEFQGLHHPGGGDSSSDDFDSQFHTYPPLTGGIRAMASPSLC
jgi:hypothetical protein